jgi:glyoxylase-like metal-dependent hydrolase (beta-lactamase superfamily II)
VLANCGEGTGTPANTSQPATTSSPTTARPTTTGAAPTTTPALARYFRVNLGFVSAYIVIRGSEAAVIDTGVVGSEGDIEAGLNEAGASWGSVGTLILTHRHPDHIGSLPPVMEAATEATAYIGAADLEAVSAPRRLLPLNDGDEIFGLRVISTPGHTAGHISLLDPEASVLVAGDAINGADGGVVGPNEQFSQDHAQALASADKLAGFTFETIYFGHGEPVLEGGSDLLRAEMGVGGRY